MIENNWTLKTFCLFFNFIENWRDQLILLCWTWFLVKNCRTKFWFIFFFHWNSFKFSTLIFENSHFLKPGRLVFIGMNFELISEDIFLVFLATVILVGIVAKLAFIFLGINTGSISSAIIWSEFNPTVVVVEVAGVVILTFDVAVESDWNSICRSISGITIFGLPVGCCCPTKNSIEKLTIENNSNWWMITYNW